MKRRQQPGERSSVVIFSAFVWSDVGGTFTSGGPPAETIQLISSPRWRAAAFLRIEIHFKERRKGCSTCFDELGSAQCSETLPQSKPTSCEPLKNMKGWTSGRNTSSSDLEQERFWALWWWAQKVWRLPGDQKVPAVQEVALRVLLRCSTCHSSEELSSFF